MPNDCGDRGSDKGSDKAEGACERDSEGGSARAGREGQRKVEGELVMGVKGLAAWLREEPQVGFLLTRSLTVCPGVCVYACLPTGLRHASITVAACNVFLSRPLSRLSETSLERASRASRGSI